jgi:hypothetical protein
VASNCALRATLERDEVAALADRGGDSGHRLDGVAASRLR